MSLFDNVFGTPTPQLLEQRAMVQAELDAEADSEAEAEGTAADGETSR